MSKKSKALNKQKNLAKKRAKKAAMRAQYDAWKIAGTNTKSKRAIQTAKKTRRANSISHPEGNCGNIGCRRCDPCKLYRNAA
jgi:hypothetical protein